MAVEPEAVFRTKVDTLYIAGPMTGIVDLNFPMFFRIEETLKSHGYNVRNPARVDEQFPTQAGEEKTWNWYMRKTIAMMLECDAVATLANWRESRGARIEVSLASSLQMPVAAWSGWVIRAENEAKL